MKKLAIALLSVSWIAVAASADRGQGTGARPAVTSEPPATQSAPATQTHQALLQQYCVTCHNARLNLPAGKPLSLDRSDLSDVAKDAATWERVIRKLATGAMPPQGSPKPTAAALDGLVSYLAGALDRAADAANNPGPFILHRLNRVEYANAIRDLFGLDVDVTALLPPDNSDFGFDNIATALPLTPALLERYLTAAVRISDLAVGDPAVEPAQHRFPVRLDFTQNGYVEGLPPGTRGGTVVRYNFPVDGEYVLAGSLFRPIDAADSGIEGFDTPNQFVITVDGVPIHAANVGGVEDHKFSSANMAGAREAVAERMRVRTTITAGPHDIGFTFRERPARTQDIFQPSLRSSQDVRDPSGLPKLREVTIGGPMIVKGVGATSTRARLFVCTPARPGDELTCARRILAAVARRAYRRPITAADLEPLMAFYDIGRRGGDFEAGIRAALPRVLASPSFLFRRERDQPGSGPHAISDLELASRLSFFLWSTIPDEELLTLAERGRLRGPGALERQVRRMLADPKSDALIKNFTGQWLALRNLERTVPDEIAFPNWDHNLRLSLQRETELLFASIVRDNRSALDLLNADYTFVNERIARHYGIPGIYGAQFRRVTLTDPNRRGLLGQGSILALTSVATRTSPVFRGKYILSTFLNTPPLPPPPTIANVLPPESATESPKTIRARLDAHRSSPVCASCHRSMDPIGFALENFDAVGQWRRSEASGVQVDASGVLVDGTAVDGPAALRQALASRPNVFVGTLTENLLTYALGRGLETYDIPVVRAIVRDAARDDYRVMRIVMGIVESRPFQMRVRVARVVDTPARAKVD